MAQNDSVSLDQRSPSITNDQEPYVAEDHATSLEHNEPRIPESHRKRACVLLGSSILQLPIWGMDGHP